MKQRTSTLEEYRKQVNIVIEYIDNHLHEPIELVRLADVSHFSPYHFHRIMRAFLGEPIGAYIVRRRLETAAMLLRYTDLPVSEIAYKVGYDVPSSLSKAFKNQYGISPADYRNDKEFIIMSTVKKDVELHIKKVKVVDVPARKVIYIRLTGEYGSLDYSGTWGELWQFVKEHKLFTAGIEHLAIYRNDPKVTEPSKLTSDLCLVVHKDANPQGKVGVKELEGGKYAMFHYQGTYQNLDAVYDKIYADLLPSSGLKLRNEPVLEKYLNNPDSTEPEKLKTEIYVPVEA